MERDMEEITTISEVIESAPHIPGYLDPEVGPKLRHSIDQRLYYAKKDYESKVRQNFLNPTFVGEVQKSLEKQSGMTTTYKIPYTLNPEQLSSARSMLDTTTKIQAYQKWYSRFQDVDMDNEWSRNKEDLSQEKEVLSSILNDESVRRVLLEKVLDLQFNSNKLVSVTASIRNQIYARGLSEDNGFDAKYKEALDKYVKDFKEPQNQDTTLTGLFGLDIDKEKRAGEFGIFLERGFY